MKSSECASRSSSDRLHPLARQRPGVFDRLLADTPEARVDGRIINLRRVTFQHAARA